MLVRALYFIFLALKDKHDFIHHHVFFRFRWRFLLRKKCPYSEFFWSVFSRILTEYSISVYLRIQSKYGKIQTRITSNKNNFHAVFLFCGKGRLVDRLFPKIHSSSTEEFSILFHCSLSSLRWWIFWKYF